MEGYRVLEIKQSVFESNDRAADQLRSDLKKDKVFLLNLMSSPGSGKTTTLRRTIAALKDEFRIGVMEADIDATVDAEKMLAAGVRSIQIHTGGECAMNASMTKQALDEFRTDDLDLLFLENIGNLVCPAEEDVGSSMNMEILSIPEGDDRPLKYPLMFQVTQVVLINKIDTRDYFNFDDKAVVERIHRLNPDSKIFFVSAKTGEGFEAWTKWLLEQVETWNEN